MHHNQHSVLCPADDSVLTCPSATPVPSEGFVSGSISRGMAVAQPCRWVSRWSFLAPFTHLKQIELVCGVSAWWAWSRVLFCWTLLPPNCNISLSSLTPGPRTAVGGAVTSHSSWAHTSLCSGSICVPPPTPNGSWEELRIKTVSCKHMHSWGPLLPYVHRPPIYPPSPASLVLIWSHSLGSP